MSQITNSFTLQVLEGANNNIVTIARSQSYIVSPSSSALFEQVVVNPSVTDLQIPVSVPSNKIVSIENCGNVDLTIKLNASNGTALTIPKTTGFINMTTTTAITSLYVTNADAVNAGALKVFIGG